MKTLPQSTVSGLHPLVGHAYSIDDSSFLLKNECINDGIIEIKLNPSSDTTVLITGGSTSDIFYEGSWVRPFSRLIYSQCCSLYSCACVGYSTSQELLRLVECINVLKPDIVISLNGVNDFGLIQSFQNKYPYVHNFQNRLFEYIAKDNCFKGKDLRLLSAQLKSRQISKVQTIDDVDGFISWAQNLSTMNFISHYNCANFYSFLQPCLGYPPLIVDPDSIEGYYMSKLTATKEWYLPSMISFYDKAVKFCEKNTFANDFTSVLGDSPSNLFEDCRHLNSIGNLLLAKAIYAMVF